MKMYGSPLCPDCVKAKKVMEENGIKDGDYEFVNVTGSMAELREFIYFREANTEVFEPGRKHRAVGVPCFVLDDGTISFYVNDVIKK
jgi:glutaredoxin-related protein